MTTVNLNAVSPASTQAVKLPHTKKGHVDEGSVWTGRKLIDENTRGKDCNSS